MPATPVAWLSDTVISQFPSGSSPSSQIIQLTNGNIVVAWTTPTSSGAGSPAGTDIVGRIFNLAGEPLTNEIRFNNASTSQDERAHSLVALPTGGFLVAFEQENLDTGVVSLRQEKYSATGVFESGTVTIVLDPNDSFPNYSSPEIEASSATSTLSAYLRQTAADSVAVVGRTFNPSTNTYGAETTLLTGGVYANPAVATLTNGNYVIVADRTPSGSDTEIALRIMSPTLTSVLPATIVAGTSGNGEVDFEPSVAALTGGGFVVTWTNTDTDTDIRFQVFSATGAPGASGSVGSTGSTDNNNESAVVAMSDGGFLVLWDNDEIGQQAIQFQRYNAAGVSVGAVVTVSIAGFSFIDDIDATLLDDGRVAISWEDGINVRMAIYDPRDATSVTSYAGVSARIGTIDGESIIGTAALESIIGGGGDDTINGEAGTDTIFGGDGDDRIIRDINDGDDSIHGGSGTDTVDFGTTTASLRVDLAAGKWGFTTLINDLVSIERVIGGSGSDSLSGSIGSDELTGAGGNDTLIGGLGADTLEGGLGRDLMTGGGGLDRMVFRSIAESGVAFANRDAINTFAHGDKIDLTAIDANTVLAGDQAFSWLGSGAFTGAAGQLRFDLNNIAASGVRSYTVYADVDGNRAADWSLQIYTAPVSLTPGDWSLAAWDFIL
jgi:Ca2+-binding RTX toxin-like protein